MFDTLSGRLSQAVASLRGRGRLTEDNVADTLRQVRLALLEADVALPVVKAFTEAARQRALGAEVVASLTPGQAFIKILHDELTRVLGESGRELNLRAQPPVVILLAGLQGAGKTTTAAKLARFLVDGARRKTLLASADVYRPAAITQLERLAAQVGAGFFKAGEGAKPVEIAREARQHARMLGYEVLIFDTAGRLHVDQGMMDEMRAVDAVLEPLERLFVLDCMAGQDAVNAASAFGAAIDLTGIVLTKADGDARGGAALSVTQVTGKPILFLGVGEKVDALEPFHPERMASRILGMGDVVSLVEQVQSQVDEEQARKLAGKLAKGGGFDLNDLKQQILQLSQMGGLSALADKLPAGVLPTGVAGQVDDRQLRRQVAIIDSMTPRERRRPALLDGSRKRRIAKGSGAQVQDVNRLLKQHGEMERMMKKLRGGGLRKLVRGLGGRLPGGLPRGFPPLR